MQLREMIYFFFQEVKLFNLGVLHIVLKTNATAHSFPYKDH